MVSYKLNIKIDTKLEDAVLRNIVSTLPQVATNAVLMASRKGAELVKRGIDIQRPEWPPLSDKTIKNKGHDIIMVDSTRFYNSIQAEIVGKAQAMYYTDVEYMPIHEFGLLEDVPKRATFVPTVEGQELQDIIEVATKTIKIGIEGMAIG